MQKDIEQFHKHKPSPEGRRASCRDCCNKKHKDYKVRNRQKLKMYFKELNDSLEFKEKRRKKYSNIENWTKQREVSKKRYSNPEYRNACKFRSAKRRTALLNATPKWSDLDKIKEIYMKCPEGLVVDHIMPLQGESLCGLHVSWNLQYLTPSENSRKKNKVME
jgi:hypothetical protein